MKRDEGYVGPAPTPNKPSHRASMSQPKASYNGAKFAVAVAAYRQSILKKNK